MKQKMAHNIQKLRFQLLFNSTSKLMQFCQLASCCSTVSGLQMQNNCFGKWL